jgi:hypothetical protein
LAEENKRNRMQNVHAIQMILGCVPSDLKATTEKNIFLHDMQESNRKRHASSTDNLLETQCSRIQSIEFPKVKSYEVFRHRAMAKKSTTGKHHDRLLAIELAQKSCWKRL